MSCATHNWMFTLQCPKCIRSAQEPALDSEEQGHTCGGSIPPAGSTFLVTDDPWEIPPFLVQTKGDNNGSVFHQPVSMGDSPPSGTRRGVEHLPLKFWPDEKLLTALSDHTISHIDRQPILEEARKRHDQVKGYERKRAFL